MKIKKLKSHKNTEPKLTIVTFNAFFVATGAFSSLETQFASVKRPVERNQSKCRIMKLGLFKFIDHFCLGIEQMVTSEVTTA